MSRDRKRPGRPARLSVMARFSSMIGAHVGNPRGLLGRVIGWGSLAKGNAAITPWIVQLLDIQPTDHILEVGCGPGLALQGLAARATRGHVAGIDCSPVMVQQARTRNAAAILAGRIEIEQGDASTLPYPDASFEKVVAVHGISFRSDAVTTLLELRRVLQPGGVVAIGFVLQQQMPPFAQKGQTQTGATPYTVAEEVAALLATAGFTHIHVERQEASRGCCVLGQKGRFSDPV